MAQHYRPLHYLIRPNGAMVPLIPLDEVPSTVRIRNVPRLLTPQETFGMRNIGVVAPRHCFCIVEGLNNILQSPLGDRSIVSRTSTIETAHVSDREGLSTLDCVTESGGRENVAASVRTSESSNTNISYSAAAPPETVESTADHTDDLLSGGRKESAPAQTATESKNRFKAFLDVSGEPASAIHPAQRQVSTFRPSTPLLGALLPLSEAAIPPYSPPPRPLPRNPTPSKKEYCSYWIRRGECDYAQQGCIYKHEMPMDLQTLRKIGLRDLPLWYREMHGLGSLLVNNGMNGTSTGLDDSRGPRPWIRHVGTAARIQNSQQDSRYGRRHCPSKGDLAWRRKICRHGVQPAGPACAATTGSESDAHSRPATELSSNSHDDDDGVGDSSVKTHDTGSSDGNSIETADEEKNRVDDGAAKKSKQTVSRTSVHANKGKQVKKSKKAKKAKKV